MFRLVLIHQLVLGLLVGPMLCCCTAARLGHESSRTSQPGDKSKPKHCCGESQSNDSGRSAPDGKPTEPEKCPCKNAPQTVVAVPEQAVSAADVLTQLSAGLATLDHPVTLHVPALTGRQTTSFDARSSTLSTDDILYAHHKLRC
jgi:hypothetical protein